MKLILPESMDAPTIPATFLSRMRDIDAGLVIYWNRFKNRFVIDRCVNSAPHTHGPHCERVNVMIVEDEEHGYMTPCDRVLDKIKSMDAWTNFGGNDEAAILRARRKHEIAKEEWDAKQKADIRDIYDHAGKDGRAQLNKALHLIQQHDTGRVH